MLKFILAQSAKLIQKLFQIISKYSKLFQINFKIQMFKIQNFNFLNLVLNFACPYNLRSKLFREFWSFEFVWNLGFVICNLNKLALRFALKLDLDLRFDI